MKQKYRGFDKPLWSRCRHPEKYGVRLTPEAEKALREGGVKIKPKRRDARSKGKSNRITYRTSEAIFEALQREVDGGKAKTMQDVVEQAVLQYLRGE